MITVHHLSSSHSHVVIWLLEELGVPYEIVHHKRDPLTARSPESLRAIHPAAKSPTIVDHGVAMIESTGIILYILEADDRCLSAHGDRSPARLLRGADGGLEPDRSLS
jgi:glutathione S-transferase